MIEVVLQPDRVVEPAPQVDDHAPLAGDAVEQAREVGHVREVRRHLDDEQGKVDAIEVGGERQRRQFRMRLAVDRDVVSRARPAATYLWTVATLRIHGSTDVTSSSFIARGLPSSRPPAAANSSRAQRTVFAKPALERRARFPAEQRFGEADVGAARSAAPPAGPRRARSRARRAVGRTRR